MRTQVQLLLLGMVLLAISGCTDDQGKKPPPAGAGTSEQKASVRMKSAGELQPVWSQLAEKANEDPELQKKIAGLFEKGLRTSPPATLALAWQQLYGIVADPNAHPVAAGQALQAFVDAKAKEVLRQVVVNPGKNIHVWGAIATASQALGKMRDTEAIPFLIYALAAQNYIQSGSAEATTHIVMKSRLIRAIRAITGLKWEADDVDITDIEDPNQFARVLRAVNSHEQVEQLLSEGRAWATQRGIQLFDK